MLSIHCFIYTLFICNGNGIDVGLASTMNTEGSLIFSLFVQFSHWQLRFKFLPSPNVRSLTRNGIMYLESKKDGHKYDILFVGKGWTSP